MSDVKKRILIGLALAHFMVIIIYNVLSLADSVKIVYGNGRPGEEDPRVLALFREAIHLRPVQSYARFSGAETGFAFFAPQVGSQYISHFHVYDAEGNLLESHSLPQLHQQESMHRYAAFLDLFQELIAKEKEDDHLDWRYARAVLRSMGQRLGSKIEGASKVKCSISVYRHPKLKSDPKGSHNTEQSAGLITIFENTIKLNAYE
jgi:hypothetical protein